MKMKMRIGGLVLAAVLCGAAAAETATYTFTADQSRVTQTGGIAGLTYEYRVTGRFQLSVDFEAGTAFFDWVDAELEESSHLPSTRLDDLFRMTTLIGTVVSNQRIEFELVTDAASALDDLADYELSATLQGNSIHVEGRFCQPFVDGFCFTLDATASRGAAGWTYEYLDDFATQKARRDSYVHSVFWPRGAFPPAEPYLFYCGVGNNKTLAMMGFRGQPAHIGYCFPLGPAQGSREVSGTLGIEVEYPNNAEIVQSPPGYLLYSLSGDGRTWSTPESLAAGHHDIPIASAHGTCYVIFLGTRVAIDNLSVHLSSSPATLYVPEDFANIQMAIDAAGDGDVIEVAPGVYKGRGNRDIEFRGKAITVRSAEGPERTIIDCEAGLSVEPVDGVALQNDSQIRNGTGPGPGPVARGHRGFYFHESETAESVLRGFTIRNGRIRGSAIPADDMRWNLDPSHPIGGGIYCEYSSPTIINCVVRDCGTELGGGIGCVGGDPTIVNCLVEACIAGGFGPMESGGKGAGIGVLRAGSVRIADSVVRNNTGYYNSRGGGLYCRKASVSVHNTNISLNGGVTEHASLHGGGVYCGQEGEVKLANCVISRNRAYVGSGVYSVRKDATGDPTTDLPRNVVRITNCTIAHNRLVGPQMPPFPGGGIHSLDTDIIVKNCIVWYNDGAAAFVQGAASKSPIVYTDIEGGYLGQGNIDLDPLFAPVNAADYHLQSVYGRWNPQAHVWVIDTNHSPCIDAGDPKDAVGNEPAPNGGRINMGAYGGTRQASKGHSHLLYHVDGINGNDHNTGLSRAQAFATIQRGVRAAENGDTVAVWPAVYKEEVDFGGKGITVQSAAEAAVVTAPNGYAFSFFKGERGNSVLRNFVITGGQYGVFCNGASPTLTNLTVVNNTFGVAAYGGADPNISNCILWDNTDGDLFQCNTVRFSCFRHAVSDSVLRGNIHKDPLFANAEHGDYHLRSTRGRFWPEHNVWVIDEQDSPCIDAGRPHAYPGAERMPNGGRLNMGAYGGTPYASMSEWPLAGDANRDGLVNMLDMALMAQQWLDALPWAAERPATQPVIIGPVDGSVIPSPVPVFRQ